MWIYNTPLNIDLSPQSLIVTLCELVFLCLGWLAVRSRRLLDGLNRIGLLWGIGLWWFCIVANVCGLCLVLYMLPFGLVCFTFFFRWMFGGNRNRWWAVRGWSWHHIMDLCLNLIIANCDSFGFHSSSKMAIKFFEVYQNVIASKLGTKNECDKMTKSISYYFTLLSHIFMPCYACLWWLCYLSCPACCCCRAWLAFGPFAGKACRWTLPQ